MFTEASSQGKSLTEIRQKAVGVLHSYYKATIPQYGYSYSRRKKV